MNAKDLLVEFYNPALDDIAMYHFDDTRRPRLTFGHIQKLRKSKDLEAVDNAQHKDFIPDMYATPEPEGGLG